MSRRAKREAESAVRWRGQVARLIAEACGFKPVARCRGCGALWRNNLDGSMSLATEQESCPDCEAAGFADLVPDVEPFDVHLAREYGERLVALEAEQVAFEDWTRTQGYEGCPAGVGMGPENRERGAFVQAARERIPTPIDDGLGGPRCGGWPGPLAREYGWRECEACEGRGEWRQKMQPFCVRCKGRGRVRRPGIPPGFANGRSLARLGRRLLDTLDGRGDGKRGCPWAPGAEGQPSECQRSTCEGGRVRITAAHAPDGRLDGSNVRGVERVGNLFAWTEDCPDCSGTGHNLSGVLPPVQVPPVQRRRARDTILATETLIAIEADGPGNETAARRPPEWIRSAYEAGRESGWTLRVASGQLDTRTRVVPRGEHRQLTDNPGGRGWSSRGTYEQTPWRGAESQLKVIDAVMSRLPRWRRGELRHAEQRRERARRQWETRTREQIHDEMARLAEPSQAAREAAADLGIQL